MKKIVRITESEINNIVKKVLKEDGNWNAGALAHGYGALGYDDARDDMDDFAKKMLSKDIGPKTEDLDGIVKILIDKGIPPSDIESIIEILYRK